MTALQCYLNCRNRFEKWRPEIEDKSKWKVNKKKKKSKSLDWKATCDWSNCFSASSDWFEHDDDVGSSPKG